MNDSERRTVGPYIAMAILILALPAIYIGAYVWLHEQVKFATVVSQNSNTSAEICVTPCHCYKYGQGYINVLFWPAEQVQELLEPEAWQNKTMFAPFNIEN